MEITLNGERREAPANGALARLLDELGVAGRNLVIEHNGELLIDADLSRVVLREGDTLEIVRFVGGG